MLTFDRSLKLALEKIDGALDRLGIEYNDRGNDTMGILCPVHQSEDVNSASLKLSTGQWKCWSYNCEKEVGNCITDLLLWQLRQSGPANTQDLINFLNDESIPYNREGVFAPQEDKQVELTPMDKSLYPSVTIPSKYFIDRGFSPEILTRFEIGDCKLGYYTNRAIVPIKSESGLLLGFSARSHFPCCKKCGFHHSRYQTCISKREKYTSFYRKWLHSKNSQKSKTFYNLDGVRGSEKVAIVEGPSCVWRLEELGIKTIACLGKDFSKYRKNLLKRNGIKKILFIADKDGAGQEFKERFIRENYLDFQIYLTNLSEKDPSDMRIEDIKSTILETWRRI